MRGLLNFARLLGLPAHQAEDALHSERAARAVLTRRSFFAASGAMVTDAMFSFAPTRIMVPYYPLMLAQDGLGARPLGVMWAYAGEELQRGALVAIRDGLLYNARPTPMRQGGPFNMQIVYVGTAA